MAYRTAGREVLRASPTTHAARVAAGGAHVDEDRSVAEVMGELEAVDLDAFDAVVSNCFDAISRTLAEDPRRTTLVMADRADVRRIGDPPGLPY